MIIFTESYFRQDSQRRKTSEITDMQRLHANCEVMSSDLKTLKSAVQNLVDHLNQLITDSGTDSD